MTQTFESMEQAFMVLANPQDPQWPAAFGYLASHPDTAKMMLEAFQDTLQDMGAEPSGLDPDSGEPIYTLKDVAQAMGIPETELDTSE